MEMNQPPARGHILLSTLAALLLLAGGVALALRALDRDPAQAGRGSGGSGSELASGAAPTGAATVADRPAPDDGREGVDVASIAPTTPPAAPAVDRESDRSSAPAAAADADAAASSALGVAPLPALRAAVALEQEGRTEDAAAAYATLADAGAQPDRTRALAAQAAARLALAAGDPAGALAQLERAPEDAAAPEALYVRGEAHAAAGRTDAAVAAYEAYAAARPAMADEAALAAGEALDAAGRPAQAARAYERARAAAATPALAALAGIRAGNAWLEAEDPASALAAYRAAADVARADAERAQALAGQVAAHLAAGDETAAMAVRRTIVAELPAAAPARISLERLRAAGLGPPPLVEARVLQAHGEAAAALVVVEAALATPATATDAVTTRAVDDPPPADRAALIALAVELELVLDRPAQALARAEAFLARSADDPVVAELAFARTRALRALGRTDEEIEALADVASADPRASSGLAFEAMFRRAILVEQRDGEITGSAAWMAAFEQDPANRRAGDAGFRAGWLAYAGGRRDTAVARWQAVAERAADELSRARAHYWLADLAADRDEDAIAEGNLLAARRFDAYGWYGLRAAERLGEPPLAPAAEEPVADARVAADEPAPTATAADVTGDATAYVALDSAAHPDARTHTVIDAWLATWGGAAPGSVAAARERLRAGDELQRATAYLALGRRRAALRAAVAARTAALRQPAELAAVALEAQAMGLHDVALGAATFLLRQAPGAQMVDAPHALWHIAYPDPWPELRARAASDVALDPALLLALMRQESRFEPTAQSSAGARGLAQVMPGTGEGIAAQLGEPAFDTDDLFRPSIAFRFGAHYIAQQLERFDGQPGPALAAYNGGPRNAARWWPEAQGEVDRLVETIDFRETRAYLRLVLTNYEIYKRLLEGVSDEG